MELFFINIYVKGTEIYKEGKLIKFNSKTNQNGKEKYVDLKLEDEDYIIDGSSYQGKTPARFFTWNMVESQYCGKRKHKSAQYLEE